jgi:hypothetical protein
MNPSGMRVAEGGLHTKPRGCGLTVTAARVATDQSTQARQSDLMSHVGVCLLLLFLLHRWFVSPGPLESSPWTESIRADAGGIASMGQGVRCWKGWE